MIENFYEYEIEYYNGEQTAENLRGIENLCGVVFAESYGAAADKLEKYYGNEIVSIKYLMATDEEDVYEFNNDMSSNLKDFLLTLFDN